MWFSIGNLYRKNYVLDISAENDVIIRTSPDNPASPLRFTNNGIRRNLVCGVNGCNEFVQIESAGDYNIGKVTIYLIPEVDS